MSEQLHHRQWHIRNAEHDHDYRLLYTRASYRAGAALCHLFPDEYSQERGRGLSRRRATTVLRQRYPELYRFLLLRERLKLGFEPLDRQRTHRAA